MNKKVIIIGGGIIGLSIGYNIIKKNSGDSDVNPNVIILDKGLFGKEASWAAAGMLRPQSEFEDENLLRLCVESIKLYPEFAKQLEIDSGICINYRTEGTIILALDNEQSNELDKRYKTQKNLGMKIERLSNSELLRLSPNAHPTPEGAVLIPGDHWADNRLIVNALIKALQNKKAEMHENCETFSYIYDGDKVIGVQTSQGKFFGNFVVNCAGSWASQIKAKDKSHVPNVKPILGQIVSVKTPDWLIRHNICTFGSYLAARDKNTVIIGSTMEDAGFEKRNTISGVNQLLENAVKLVPKLSSCEITDLWSGLRPAAPDLLPILGKTNADGLIIATGTYRNGILLTPIVGKLVSELILNDNEDELLNHFGIGRFYC